MTGDATFLIFEMVVGFLRMSPNGILGQVLTVVLKRPATPRPAGDGRFLFVGLLKDGRNYAEDIVEPNAHA